jgi:hypothetical protein
LSMTISTRMSETIRLRRTHGSGQAPTARRRRGLHLPSGNGAGAFINGCRATARWVPAWVTQLTSHKQSERAPALFTYASTGRSRRARAARNCDGDMRATARDKAFLFGRVYRGARKGGMECARRPVGPCMSQLLPRCSFPFRYEKGNSG